MKDTICMMKDVLMAFNEFEKSLIRVHSLSLNEAMVLCLLEEKGKAPGRLSASAIAEKTGFTASHTSKVLRSAESRKWISRSLCPQDRRKMYFELTSEGRNKLGQLKNTPVEIPELLKKLF
ncbi:MAG TPA: winged helix DNA-binding protein [Bacteroidales bacterium]|nr:winged helix DNA-binding protein [Bacteroidales bacterium]HOZ19323.1 winged helix DNA-binding protein [Bacteroidales bacterium]HPB78125.1 winged helix DNA-binding protein [Bacteroidales bacterium]HPK38393.1 winged helix DNA-binding protein [Bacteroidales bacterium]HQN81655.1 winged helix DNA-binding protein [Bacteroidales bacterium]